MHPSHFFFFFSNFSFDILKGSLSHALGLKFRNEEIYQNGIESSHNPSSSFLLARSSTASSQRNADLKAESKDVIYQNVNCTSREPSNGGQAFVGMSPGERPRSSVVPSSVATFVQREKHRRVRSISDIEHITVTPV